MIARPRPEPPEPLETPLPVGPSVSVDPRLPGAIRKAQRAELLANPGFRGAAVCEPLTVLTEQWLQEGWAAAPTPSNTEGWALLSAAGTSRREMCPGSDIDVVLVHPAAASASEVNAIAEALWYPLWDAGAKVSALVHTVRTALDLAGKDLVTATTLLDITHIAGDKAVTDELARGAAAQWKKRARRWMRELADSVSQRHGFSGEVAFLLEPDLREGRGGLRDVHALRWAGKAGWPGVEEFFAESETEVLDRAEQFLRSVRVELHRTTDRRGDRLLLQEQDCVAAALALADADELVRAVSSAARTISWTSDRFWHAMQPSLNRTASRLLRRQVIGPDIAFERGEIVLRHPVDRTDRDLLLRVAAGAADFGAPLARSALRELALSAAAPAAEGEVWSERSRNSLVSLLGSGARFLAVIEDLDQFELMARILPEWSNVRAKPQRNAYHRYTVDWHLCQAAVNASRLVRQVSRPDLLLVGTWLHDIGKGFPGDHTEVGKALVESICTRMGFSAADVALLVAMEEHHLLLPEAATRRDLSDPATVNLVAQRIGDVELVGLLHALTIADSLATGPSAWSDWKAGLVRELVRKVEAVLGGHRPPEESQVLDAVADHGDLADRVRADGLAHVLAKEERPGHVTVAAFDRPGVFALFAGVLSLHGLDVVSAEASSVGHPGEPVAIDDFTVSRRLGGDTDWRRVERDIRAALNATLDLDVKLAEKVRTYASARSALPSAVVPQAEVLVDDQWSQTATVIEIRAPDSIAALYRMTSVFARLGVDIRSARVETLGHEVVDVFYVSRLNAERREVVISALKTELDVSIAH